MCLRSTLCLGGGKRGEKFHPPRGGKDESWLLRRCSKKYWEQDTEDRRCNFYTTRVYPGGRQEEGVGKKGREGEKGVGIRGPEGQKKTEEG